MVVGFARACCKLMKGFCLGRVGVSVDFKGIVWISSYSERVEQVLSGMMVGQPFIMGEEE